MAIADMLRVIQPLKAAQANAAVERRWHGSAVLPRLVAREELEGAIEPYLDALLEEFPLLFRQRRLYDGAWAVSLHGALPRPGQRRLIPSCTTLDIVLRIEDGGDAATLTSRVVVADQELPGDQVHLIHGATGRWEVEPFMEQACLQFARAYAAASRGRC